MGEPEKESYEEKKASQERFERGCLSFFVGAGGIFGGIAAGFAAEKATKIGELGFVVGGAIMVIGIAAAVKLSGREL